MSRQLRNLALLIFLIFARPGFGGANPRPPKSVPFREAAQFIIQEVRPNPDFKDLKKFIEETPRPSPQDTPETISKALAKYIFETWKIEPDTSYESRKSRDNVFPDSVLAALFYEKSAEKSPRFAEAYSNLASLKSEMGAPSDEVLSLLKKAENANPTHYATALNLAAFYQNKRSIKESIRYYDRAIQSNPVSFVAYLRRARLLSQIGREKDALSDLERALIIQPKSCAVREARVQLRKKLAKSPAIDPELRKLRASGACQ